MTMSKTQKITPYLWFDGNAEQAVEHYTSLFPRSRVTKVARWGKGGPGKEGSVMNIAFELDGQPFIALNGGPHFKFTPAISLFASCETQEGSTRCGRASSPPAARRPRAAGSRTSSACPGRSSRPG
jgi:predicted 3-demethylubiquinone-9 3-methyltransferase (glyoxalase superfamily)